MASRSLETVLFIAITVLIVGVAFVAQKNIMNTNTEKASKVTANLYDKLKLRVIYPPDGGMLTFQYPVVYNGKNYYGAKIKFYSTLKLENDKIPIKLKGIEIDHVIITNEKQVVYNDGGTRYNYEYEAMILVDPQKFKKEVEAQDNQTLVFVGDERSLNQLGYFNITEKTLNSPLSLSELSQPKLYVYLYFDQATGQYKVLKIVKEDNSASQPTAIVVNDGSGTGPQISSISIDGDTYTPSNQSNTYVSSTSNPSYGDNATVVVYNSNGQPIGGGTAPVISGSDNNNDGVIDQPTAQPDERFLYIDGSYVLHYRIFNYDTNNPADIQITNSSDNTKNRWVLVEIKDYQGTSKTSAENAYNNGTGTPTQTITTTQIAGRTTTVDYVNATPITENNTTIGYILNPNGYIDESADLSQWLNDDKYHILNITFYINGYLWNTTSNSPSNQPYQLVLSYRYDIDNTNKGSSNTTTDDSGVQQTTADNNANVNYIIFYAQNTLGKDYIIGEDSNADIVLPIDVYTIFKLREGNTTRGTDQPVVYDFNSLWYGRDSGNGYDYGIYTTTNDSNYQTEYRESQVTDTILNNGETLVIKVDSTQLPYGIYYINVSTSDGKYLLTKYFLWDGTGIYWMDVSSNVGNYYDTEFPYKKDYSIHYSGNTVFGYQVLVHVIFTNDTSIETYKDNVQFSESALGVDLNGDGDTNDVVTGTLFGYTMYDAMMTNVGDRPVYGLIDNGSIINVRNELVQGSIDGRPAWKTSNVGIRFTYYEPGLGEMEIPFYIANVTGPKTITVDGKQYDVYVADIYIKVPVIRDSSTGDNNGGYLYWRDGIYQP